MTKVTGQPGHAVHSNTHNDVHNDPVLGHEWLVVAAAQDVENMPRRVCVLGQNIVLWRSPTGIQAFRDLCLHRGAALSLGRVVGGTLVCPYHGWRYAEDGGCVHIPAHSGAPIPTKARATRYPCTEQHGLVWVSLGTPGTPVPAHPEAADPAFITLHCGPYHLEALAPRIIENFLDVSHLMWVHEGLLGVSTHADIPDYRVHDRGETLASDPIAIYQPDPDGRGKVVTNSYVYEVLRPLSARFRKTDPRTGETFVMMLSATPGTKGETVVYALLSRNYDLDAPADTYRAFQDTLMAQDQKVIESQRPELLPLDLQAELHLKSDRLAIAYRRYLARLGVQTGVA